MQPLLSLGAVRYSVYRRGQVVLKSMVINTENLIGRSAEVTTKITSEVISRFAELCGDENPIHLSDEAAALQGFKGRIAHGVLQASFLSAIVGMELPGPGSVLQQLELKWLKPCYVGDEIRISLEITEAHESVQTVICKALITNQRGEVISRGRLQVGVGGLDG